MSALAIMHSLRRDEESLVRDGDLIFSQNERKFLTEFSGGWADPPGSCILGHCRNHSISSPNGAASEITYTAFQLAPCGGLPCAFGK